MERKWPVNASIRKWDMPQVVYMTSGTYVSTQCWWTQRGLWAVSWQYFLRLRVSLGGPSLPGRVPEYLRGLS